MLITNSHMHWVLLSAWYWHCNICWLHWRVSAPLSRWDGELVCSECYWALGTAPNLATAWFVGCGHVEHLCVRTSSVRLFVPEPLRKNVIRKLHNISHSGVGSTKKLIKQRFVWPSMHKEISQFFKHCTPYQKSKISRHVRSPLQQFTLPTQRLTTSI